MDAGSPTQAGLSSDKELRMDDWDIGSYEDTAAELAPAAAVAVAALGLEQGERVLDVACGSGNAALVAAVAGAGLGPRRRRAAARRSARAGAGRRVRER